MALDEIDISKLENILKSNSPIHIMELVHLS